MTYDRLRIAVKEAWDAIEDWYLEELLSTMPERCEAVIAADGLHTRY